MAKTTAKPMTKSAIIDRLSTDTELPKKKINEVMEALTTLAYSEAKKGFTIPGLGKLVCQQRKARMGRNPKTGETMKIPAKTVVKFRVGKQAKDAVLNGGKAVPKATAAKPAAKPAAKAPAKKK